MGFKMHIQSSAIHSLSTPSSAIDWFMTSESQILRLLEKICDFVKLNESLAKDTRAGAEYHQLLGLMSVG